LLGGGAARAGVAASERCGGDQRPVCRAVRSVRSGIDRRCFAADLPLASPAAGCYLTSKSIPHDAPEGAEGVFEADLLTLGVVTAGVGDGYFVYSPATAGDLGRQFRLDAEAVLFDR